MNLGLHKQFYIPDIRNWDLSKFNFDIDDEVEQNDKILLECPFCGGTAQLIACYDNNLTMAKSVYAKSSAIAEFKQSIPYGQKRLFQYEIKGLRDSRV